MPTRRDVPPQAIRLADLDETDRHRAVRNMLLRIAGSTVGLLVLYGLLPAESRSSTIDVVLLGVVIVGVGAIVAFQVRSVTRAKYPQLRGGEVLVLSVELVLLTFAGAYVLLSASDPAAFNEDLDKVGALYLSMTTLTTVGFGDVTARTNFARILVMLQMVADVGVIAGGSRMVVIAVRSGLARATDPTDLPPSSPNGG